MSAPFEVRSDLAAGRERPAANSLAGSPYSAPLELRVGAEGIGSFMLFACVIGSGIMAERLAAGNGALALLGNTLATGAILYVLIAMLGPISGAHMNPAVTLVAASRGELCWSDMLAYLFAQFAFGILGVFAAHFMFGMPALELSAKARAGLGQWASEAIATFGLILTILGTMRLRPDRVPASVAMFITAAYWFTSSTSFANPAITVARSLTNSFSGIAPSDVPPFIIAQLFGAGVAAILARWLFDQPRSSAPSSRAAG
jgi:glycerol uptake facilitator-like aquaporin